MGTLTIPQSSALRTYKFDYISERDEQWMRKAYNVIRRMAEKKPIVHVNDFWDHVEKHKMSEPDNRKVLGLVFKALAKDGVLRVTDTAMRVNPQRGSYWRPIWSSQIYKTIDAQ